MSPTFEERLAALEARVAGEADLRAAVDRDLATVSERQRAANHLIQTLSLTQNEHTATLARHSELLVSAHAKLDLIVELLRSQAAPSSCRSLGRCYALHWQFSEIAEYATRFLGPHSSDRDDLAM